jgi:outer membrane protein TolC
MKIKFYFFKNNWLPSIFLLTLTACSMNIKPIDNFTLFKESKEAIRANQEKTEPINSTIDINEAIARGLKYNLEFKVKQYEEALSINQSDLSAFDMLPKIVGSTGYYKRNNDAINTSVNAQTGQASTSTFISTDRQIDTVDLGLSWNILDFGASYFNARQQGDRALIALEHRRKAMHNLVQDIRTAYLRAYAAQTLEDEVASTIEVSEIALKKAKQADEEKFRNPTDILKIQKTILDNLRVLEAIRQELSTARYELASYMNITPGTKYKLAEPSSEILAPKQINLSIELMEDLAITNNADFKEQIYTARIAKDEIKKNMLKMFPNISLNAGPHYSSNSFLVNKHWNDAAIQASWNIVNVLTIPSQISAGKNADKLFDEKKSSVLMGLITQVHISRLIYDNAYQSLERNESVFEVDKRLNDISQLKVNAALESKLDNVTYRTAYILSLLRKYQALSQLYAAEGKLRSTLGQEVIAGDISKIPLNDLKGQVNTALKDWLPSEDAIIIPKEPASNTEIKVDGVSKEDESKKINFVEKLKNFFKRKE